MKILVVDDEELLVKGIRFNLQNDGYEVIFGSNGVEAVSLAQSQQPDLIVLDVMMPQMDGMELVEKNVVDFADRFVHDSIVLSRITGTGYIPQEQAIKLACSGPTLRATGVKRDLRTDMYEYDNFDYDKFYNIKDDMIEEDSLPSDME